MRLIKFAPGMLVSFTKDFINPWGLPEDAQGIYVERDKTSKFPIGIVSFASSYKVIGAMSLVDSYGMKWENCVRIWHRNLVKDRKCDYYQDSFDVGDRVLIPNPKYKDCNDNSFVEGVIRGIYNNKAAVEVTLLGFKGSTCSPSEGIEFCPNGHGTWVYPEDMIHMPHPFELAFMEGLGIRIIRKPETSWSKFKNKVKKLWNNIVNVYPFNQ